MYKLEVIRYVVERSEEVSDGANYLEVEK